MAKKSRTKSGATAARRREIFAAAYLANGLKGGPAAITAGLSEKTADQSASRLLRHPDVIAMIKAGRDEMMERFELTTERTLREVARLAYADPGRLKNRDGTFKQLHELDDDTRAMIASVEEEIGPKGERKVKYKLWDKNPALDKAMKYHGLFEKDNKQQPPMVFSIKF